MKDDLPLSVTLEVRDRCLCLHLQRAARAIGRVFDDALKPFGLTNGQFSLLMSLNRPEAPSIGEVARFLAMDRTTLTAALKPLERRGLAVSTPDPKDARIRRLSLSHDGRALLAQATPTWRETHDRVDGLLALDPEALKADLKSLAFRSE
ncbi:MAG: MarR family transcriptional regulator [Pseudomonadota bacterium]